MLDRDEAKQVADNTRAMHAAGVAFLRSTAANDPEHGDYSFEDKERLMKVMWAKEIGLAYLEDCYNKLHRKIVLQNSDGNLLQFYTLSFP